MSNEILETILKSIQESNDKQTQELKLYINQEIEEIKKIVNREAQRITKLEEQYRELSTKYQNLEKSLKKNNVIIFGLKSENNNLLEYVIEKLNDHLEINLNPSDINNIYKIGKQPINKPVIVQFTSYLQKINVLKNCKKLKNTGITISEDLSLEQREELKILRQHLNIARSKNLNSYIRGTKLYVNGECYTAKKLLGDGSVEEVHRELGETNTTEIPEEETAITKQFTNNPGKSNEQEIQLEGNQPKRRKVVTTFKQDRCSSRIADKTNFVKDKLVGEK